MVGLKVYVVPFHVTQSLPTCSMDSKNSAFCVPSCDCMTIAVWEFSLGEREEEVLFKCETLKELDINSCDLTHVSGK